MMCPTPEKRWYQTRQAAQDAATVMTARFGHRMHPYGCECGQFHLTSRQRPYRKNRPTSSLSPEAKRRKRRNWKANRRAREALAAALAEVI